MGAERRSRAGDIRADANPGKGARRAWKSTKRVTSEWRMRASGSGVRPWRAVWRRGTAVALSCILAAGLVPVASFAQGSETVAAARESLRANASGTADGGAGNGIDAANGFAADGADGAADSADGGVLVVGSEVVAGGEGPAVALGAQGSQSAQNPQGAQAAAGVASSIAGGLAGDAGDASGVGGAADSANAAGDADPDPDVNDPGPAPDYDGTEAAYVYDDYYGEYLLATAKGVTGNKADGDVGYVAGTATPAQVWLTLDEETNELTVHHVDNGAVAFEVPATVDGRPITTVGGCGSSSLTSVTFPADSRVTRLSWGAFSGSPLQSIALPSSLETLGDGVFQDCKKLQTVEWPKKNDMLKTIPAETFAGCSMLDDSVVASIPASVETIDYRAFARCSPDIYVQGETPEPFTEVNVPGTVKTVERNAFEGCSHVRSISIGDGVQTIGNRAFAGMPLMAGAEVVLPATVSTVGQDAFDNTQITSSASGTEWKRNAVTLRVLNPDFELTEYEYGGTLEIDGKKYENPFSLGQTIVAFAKNSAGQPSWIKRAADAVTGQEDEHNPGKPAYTFQWMEESSQVTGKVPAGAQVTLFQNGVATAAKVSADGTFAVEALSNTPATLQVSLEGCYDKVLTRAAEAMAGTWDVGELKADSFEKLPAQRLMNVNLRKQVGTGDDGAPAWETVLSDSGLAFELRQGDRVLREGEDADYVRQGLSVLLSQEVADAAKELTLAVTPDDSLALGAGEGRAVPADGAFDVDLRAWGGMMVTTKSAFSGSNDVMVFRNGACVATGLSDSAGELPFSLESLKAGAYTVIAVNHTSVDLRVPTLAAFDRLKLEEGVHYARAEVQVEDGAQAQVALDVPVFDASAYLTQCGVMKNSGVVADRSAIVAGVEAQVRVSFDLDRERDAVLQLEMPEGDFSDITIGGNIGDEAKQLPFTRNGDVVSVDLGGAQTGDLYVRFAAQRAGACTVNAVLALGDAVLPLGAADMSVYDAGIELPSSQVTAVTGNKATVYAAPDSRVELEVGGKRFAGTCNKLGRASIDYDVPDNLVPGQRVMLQAYLSGAQQPAATAYVTYTGGASIERFDVVTRGKTQRLIDNGKETEAFGYTLHHERTKKNAYWTFAITLDAHGAQLDDEFNLYVDCIDGRTVTVPMKKRATDGDRVRFVGEYVDQAYLDLLAEDEAAGITGQVWLGDMKGLFIPSSYGVSNSLLSGMATVDANVVVKNIAEQSTQKVDQINAVLVGDLTDRDQYEQQQNDEFRKDLLDAVADDQELAASLADVMNELGDSHGYLTGTAADERNTFWYQVLHGDGVLESDWFAELFGAQYDDPEVQEGVDTLRDLVISQHNDFEKYRKAVGEDMGVGDLSQYNDWDEVFIASLENNVDGITVSDFDGDAAGFTETINQGGYRVRTRMSDDGTGFKAIVNLPSGAVKTLQADFEDAAKSNIKLATMLDSVNLATDFDKQWANLALQTIKSKPVFKAMQKFTSPMVRGHLAAFLQYQDTYRMPWKWAKNVPVYSGAIASIGLGTSYIGAKDALSNAEDTEVRLAEMRGEVEHIEMLIRWYSGKGDIANLKECLEALQNELFYAKRLVSLLEQQRANEYADAGIGVVMGGIGAGATLFCPPAGAVLVSGMSYGYDVSSSMVNSDRAKNLSWAQRMYQRAVAERMEKCQPVEEEIDRQREKRRKELSEIEARLGIDPSGYVYEAVKSNRLEDVTAEVWYSASADGAGAVPWDAQSYEQVNPQPTDGDGVFGWYTPVGFYQVRFTKAGYEEARTEWMAVPPVRTGLEIGLRTTEKPQVESARAYTDCVELTFSQYMDASDASLAELTATGLGEGCTFEWVGSEEGADGRQVAKALRIKPAKALEAGSTVELSLAGAVNYAGIPMDGWNSGLLAVGARAAELKLNVEQGYSLVTGQSCEVSAYVRDASGQPLAGQLVVANVGSSVVAGLGGELEAANGATGADGQLANAGAVSAAVVGLGDGPGTESAVTDAEGQSLPEQLANTGAESSAPAGLGDAPGAASTVADENGVARFALFGEAPGMTDLTVTVADEQTRPARPTAQLGEVKFGAGSPKENFATVKKGAQLVLSAEEGTTVYFTTDDTCPCVDGGSRVEYTAPVTASGNTRFRIAAFKEGLENEYSERLNITVTVTEGDEPGGEPGGGEPGGGDGPQGPGGGEPDGQPGAGGGSGAGEAGIGEGAGSGTGDGVGTGAGVGNNGVDGDTAGNGDQPTSSGMQAGKPATATSAATGDTPRAIASLALGAAAAAAAAAFAHKRQRMARGKHCR